MNLTDLLRKNDIDPKQVLVFRHRPTEPALNRALPFAGVGRGPDLFNAYQQDPSKTLEKVMAGGKARYIASFMDTKQERLCSSGCIRLLDRSH